MHLEQNKPVFVRHPVTGVKTWFNQVYNHNNTHENSMPRFVGADIPDNKMPRHTLYGNGRDIEPEVLQHMRTCASDSVGMRCWFQVAARWFVSAGQSDCFTRAAGFYWRRKILVYLNA